MLLSRRSALPRRFLASAEEEFCPGRNGLATPENYVVCFDDDVDVFSAGGAAETYSELNFIASSDAQRTFTVPNDAQKIELFVSTPGGLDAQTDSNCISENCTSSEPNNNNCNPVIAKGVNVCTSCQPGGAGRNMFYDFDLTGFCGNGTLEVFIEYAPFFNQTPNNFPTNDTTVTLVRPRILYTPDGGGSSAIRWQSFTSGNGNGSPDQCKCGDTTGSCDCVFNRIGERGDPGQSIEVDSLPSGVGSVDGIGTITYTATHLGASDTFVFSVENQTNVEIANFTAFGTRVDPTDGTGSGCSGLDPVTVAIARFS